MKLSSRRISRNLFALAMPLIAFVFQFAFRPLVHPLLFFYYPAIFFASFLGEFFVGVTATFITAALVWYFYLPDILPLIVFMTMGIVFSEFHRRLRKTRQETEQSMRDLRASDERLELATNAANVGIWSWNFITNTGQFSPTFVAALGYTAAEFPQDSMAIKDLIHPDDRDAALGMLRKYIKEPWPDFETEFRLRHKSGAFRWVCCRAKLYRDDSGVPQQILGIHLDITQRKHTEQRFRALLDAAPDAMVVVGREGRILYTNIQFEKLFGYSSSEIQGKEMEILMPQRFRSAHVGHRDLFAHNPQSRRMGSDRELFGVRKDGVEIPIEISLSPLKSDGDFMVSASIRDITDRRKLERELKQAKDLAEAASQAKSMFLANMSHEIRSPLGIVMGFAELIASQCSSVEERAYAEQIRRNGQNLLALINDILDLSKVESGRMDIERRRFSLLSCVVDVLSGLRMSAEKKGLRLHLRIEGKVPETIDSDEVRLRQIIVNIVGNALKFTGQGEISVILKLTDALEILVKDTGCGIAPEKHEKIFAPFTQAEPSTTRRFGGTGLGLSLSRRLAKSLGGDLRLVTSEIDRGSVFSITLNPGDLRNVALVGEDELKALPSSPESPLSHTDGHLKGVRALLVDDSEDNQLLVKTVLAHHGAEVDVASNGEEGVRKAMSNAYDVILMDLQMPSMDGYCAVAKLRQDGYSRPIIAVSANAMKGESDRCVAAGFTEYVPKPIPGNTLVGVVERYARASQAKTSRG